MEKDTEPALCKSVFKSGEAAEELSSSVTAKWIELIKQLERKSVSLKGDE